MSLFSRFEAFELDVLKEVGNIGAGNAATALSRLLDKPVDMAVPKVSLLPFEEVANRVGGSEQVVIAVFLRVEGEAPGNMFFIIQEQSAKSLLSQLLALRPEEQEGYSEMELSALCEIGNILAGSYLSSLADFTHLTMAPSVPSVALDMAGAILSYGLVQYGEMGDSALLIETTFLEDRQELEGHFFLIPDPESFNKIFKALGVTTE
ncbi:chemotaxis protein CheC [Paenibacillus radicis (ex Gao et al. 2016)]|uniref:CheY-P-specific phosphatase CheC n=1 Tax=Paenibacillus radicis (ex Gao et al. 2016) TaxID=1737354 RepID=A0A917HJZ7_9BACL|nr:chemotaxis protein CheC [Paenibacillus radicis (ex Gao et al. 2016)]GGG80638.1 CheY-P-specific phosphatase CheC [Paenibacillus radicis (ex Gao et al. 2016)]